MKSLTGNSQTVSNNMKKKSYIIIFLLLTSFSLLGQNIEKSDSLKIIATLETVFEIFENPDYMNFKSISTNQIYCIPCSDKPDLRNNPYMYNRKDFFKNYLTKIYELEYWKKAVNSEKIIFFKDSRNKKFVDIIVFITTWKENEFAEGHEGAQLGLHFKKIEGEYKFAGIETIP